MTLLRSAAARSHAQELRRDTTAAWMLIGSCNTEKSADTSCLLLAVTCEACCSKQAYAGICSRSFV